MDQPRVRAGGDQGVPDRAQPRRPLGMPRAHPVALAVGMAVEGDAHRGASAPDSPTARPQPAKGTTNTCARAMITIQANTATAATNAGTRTAAPYHGFSATSPSAM